MKNNKKFDLLVIGSGLACAGFISSYLKKNKSINIISPNNIKIKSIIQNRHLNGCPPQYYKNQKNIEDYQNYNKINFNDKIFIIGSLAHGGMSENWGYQIDKDYINDINYLSKKTKDKINECFNELFNKKINLKKDNFIKKILKFKYINHKISQSNLAILKEKQNKITNNNTYSFNNLIREEKFKNKILIHNYFVDTIFKSKNCIGINVLDKNNKKKTLYTKKVVLACGTIISTSLILKFLQIKKKIRLMHHPRLVAVFLSRLKLKIPRRITPVINMKSNKKMYLIDFRYYNYKFAELLKYSYKKFFPLNIIIYYTVNFFKKRLIFSNIFYSSSMSRLYLQIKKNNNIYITNKKNKFEFFFIKVFKNLKTFLFKKKMIFNICKYYISEYGSDYHYFGTLKFGNKSELSINERCQLKNNKNVYIIDGSCFNFKSTFFPAGLIMANARRIGKLL